MAEPNGPNGVLTSWKEIARFFNREVRTVQLWEKEEGLPVHRHFHRRQGSVYAMREELEEWWKRRSARPGNTGVSDAPAAGDPIVAATAVEASPPPDAEAQNLPFSGKGRGWWVYCGAAALLALLVWGIADRVPETAAPTQALQAIPVPPGSGVWGPLESSLADLNGDGRDDLVFAAQPNYSAVSIRLARETPLETLSLSETSDITIHGTGKGSLSHVSADLNGDGIRDLVVAENLSEPYGFTNNGQTYIFWGRREWPKSLHVSSDADLTLSIGTSNDSRLAPCAGLNSPADLNHDGLDDLLLGAHEYTEAGRRSAGGVFVLWGRHSWPKEMEVVADADVRIVGARMGEGLGGPCDAGDFNGDGRMDLAAYAGESTLWEMRGNRGRSYIFFGRPTWPRLLDAATDFDFRVDGEHSVSAPSLRLADINGDRRADLVLLHDNMSPPADGGEIMAWFGDPARRGSVQESAADLLIHTSWPKSDWGASLSTADLDDDGAADLLLSAPGSGAVTLLYGRQEWKPRGSLEEFSPVNLFSGKPGAGYFNSWIRDVDRDLLPELIVWSAPGSEAAREAGAWIVKAQLPVALEVRPKHDPNILYLPEGLLVVGIRGESRPAVESVAVESLRLTGTVPVETVQADYNGDGVLDLQLYFETATLRVTPETTRVVLTGRTREGLPAAAADSVQVVMKSAASSDASRPLRR